MKTYLVTGGAGFIGSNLVRELVKQGLPVRVVDNFLTGKRENLNSLLSKIELIEGDIRELETCKRAVNGIDYVLHQAALPSVPRSIENPLLTNEINVEGTLNLLWTAKESKVKRFVFASSSSVYGDDSHLPKKEGREGAPLSPYAASKLLGEKYCQVFSKTFGLSTVCLRYFNVFGPCQDPFSQYAAVIPNFILKILKGENPIIFGDGQQSRDFTYVDNIVTGNLLALEAPNVSGEVFNIACSKRITITSLALQIAKILRKKIVPFYDNPRPGDIMHSFAAITKARKMLRYEPEIGFREGLEKTIIWFRERKKEWDKTPQV